jgi:hypothetical protein
MCSVKLLEKLPLSLTADDPGFDSRTLKIKKPHHGKYSVKTAGFKYPFWTLVLFFEYNVIVFCFFLLNSSIVSAFKIHLNHQVCVKMPVGTVVMPLR